MNSEAQAPLLAGGWSLPGRQGTRRPDNADGLEVDLQIFNLRSGIESPGTVASKCLMLPSTRR